MDLGLFGIILVIFSALLPSIFYVLWVRNAEICRREPLALVFLVLFFGATGAFGAAFIIESSLVFLIFENETLLNKFLWSLFQPSPGISLFIIAVLLAPVVEESVKAGGVFLSYKRIIEFEDGLVYGAAIGLGFAATENIVYFSDALQTGFNVFLVTAIMRTLTSTILHASSTAVSGYGICKWKLFRQIGQHSGWLKYLVVGIILHGSFNFFAIMGLLFSSGMEAYFIGLLLCFILATVAFRIMRLKIRELDAAYGCKPHRET